MSGLATVAPHLRVLPEPTEINEARLYSLAEVAELTSLSADFWRGEAAAGAIRVVRAGKPGRNQRLLIPHKALLAWIEAHTD